MKTTLFNFFAITPFNDVELTIFKPMKRPLMKPDLNVDAGEGFNIEAKVLPYVTSCNIACCGHAGNVETMRETVFYAMQNDVLAGAHPGYPDPGNFGRIEMNIPKQKLFDSIRRQIDGLAIMADRYSYYVSHIKPHGALYHKLCWDEEYAEAFVQMVKDEYYKYPIVGLPNSVLEAKCDEAEHRFKREGFGDRAYEADGKLRDRSKKGASLKFLKDIIQQSHDLHYGNPIKAFDGSKIELEVETICFHGDSDNSVFVIEKVYEHFRDKELMFQLSV